MAHWRRSEQETSVGKMIGLPMAYYALGRKADSDAALAALIADAKFEGLPCDVDRIRLTVKREVNPA